jgi:hypothetical protein
MQNMIQIFVLYDFVIKRELKINKQLPLHGKFLNEKKWH